MKFTDFATDVTSEEEGKWFELGEGTRIKLRSFQSERSVKVRETLEVPYLALKRSGKGIPQAEQEGLLIKQMAQAIIADWEGFTDEKDEPVPYNPKTAEKMLNEYREFRNMVARIVTDDDAFKLQEKAEAEKN